VGHEGGDAVLKAVGETVRSQIRQTDSVGRSRDDELLVLLPETDATGARTIAERLRQAIAVVPVLYAGMNLEANVSIGLTTFSAAEEPHLADVELLLQRADQALFQAKSSGRNRVEDGAARLPER
jgi:diguanylate cyclase (GGDEF)-like protein